MLAPPENLLVVTKQPSTIAQYPRPPTKAAEIFLTGAVVARADGGMVGGLTAEIGQTVQVSNFSRFWAALPLMRTGNLLEFDGQKRLLVSAFSAIGRSRTVMVASRIT